MKSIINILQNDTNLVALLGSANQIGMNTIEQGRKTPYVIVDIEDAQTTNEFAADGLFDFVRVTVFSVADRAYTSGSVVGADEVAKAVRDALNYVSAGTYADEVISTVRLERRGRLQEDRIANKKQVTREDEYMVTVRPTTAVAPGDSDADAWIARLTSPTQTEQDAIQTFVVAEKSDGNWSLYDEFYLLSLGATNGLVGAKSKTATAFGGVTFDVNGVLCNGTNAYLDLNWNPSSDGVNYKQDDALIGLFQYSVVDGTATSIPIGATTGSTRSLFFKSGSVIGFDVNAQSGSNFSGNLEDNSYYVLAREDSSMEEFYTNGVEINSQVSASISMPNNSIYVGCQNANGSPSTFSQGLFSSIILGAAVGFDHAAHNTNVRTLLTDLGVTL